VAVDTTPSVPWTAEGGGPVSADDITDSGTVGRAILQSENSATALVAMGAAASGHNHAGVYEPAGVAAADITDSTATGRSIITAADAAAVRTAASAAAASHGHAQADVTNLAADLAAKQATLVSGTNIKTVNGSTLLGSGDLAVSASLTSASAFATAATTVSTATYMDITGCSVTLAAGTWLIMGQVNIMAANAIVQAFVAITHNDNTVISEVAASRPASGTASLNSPFSCNPIALVSPGAQTVYKLRGARGLTTHTGSWTAVDGNGVNTTNHATNNTDKGTAIFAVKIA
jgi:hypothetical protein